MSAEYYARRRASQRQAIVQLQHQKNALQAQLVDLEQQRVSLQRQHEIVSALCDFLLYILPSRQTQQQHNSSR